MSTSVYFIVVLGIFLCFNESNAKFCEEKVCTADYTPVCALNLKTGQEETFGNICMYQNQKSCQKEKYDFQHEGKCISLRDVWRLLLGADGKPKTTQKKISKPNVQVTTGVPKVAETEADPATTPALPTEAPIVTTVTGQ